MATTAVVPTNKNDGDKSEGEEDLTAGLPVEWFWVFLRKSKRENFFCKLVAYMIFIALFTTITQLARPVKATFTIQNTILAHTSEEAFPYANFEKTFNDIANDADWWEWTETVLIPAIMSDSYFNGESRAKSWGKRFMNTVSMYNTQTSPVRFRQVRVEDDSCDTPAENSELARPCWGPFSKANQFRGSFGEDYGNKYLTGLSQVTGKEGFGGNYGTEAHVVDIPLDKEIAVQKLKDMKKDLWLNEQTRAITIESSWYNANLDMSTYCRWHVDISPGGRYQPYVVIYSCRLNPYSTAIDRFRGFVEGLFTMMLIYYWAIELYEIKSLPNKKAYFTSLWNWVELGNLGCYVFIMLYWFMYISIDKAPFQQVASDMYDKRPDIYPLAQHYNYASNLAAFNIVFAYVKVFKYLQMYPSLSTLWRTLELSMTDTLPFLVVFLLFTSGFTFAGHWIFGFMMVEFHSWTQSFSTLVQTMGGGLPYDDMKQFSPIGAAIFTMAWILMMAMVLVNMFVAILTDAHAEVNSEIQKEESKLTAKVGQSAQIGFFGGAFRYFYTKLTGDKNKAQDGGDGQLETIYDYGERTKDVNRALKKVDLRQAEKIREALIKDENINAGDVADLFGGDMIAANDFVKKMRSLMEAGGADTNADDEQELKEQQRLKILQLTVERLESQLKQLRGALHEALIAPVGPGQAVTGYTVQQEQHLALPGSVNS